MFQEQIQQGFNGTVQELHLGSKWTVWSILSGNYITLQQFGIQNMLLAGMAIPGSHGRVS